MHTHIYIHTHTYIYTHIYMHIYSKVYIYIHILVFIYLYVYIHTEKEIKNILSLSLWTRKTYTWLKLIFNNIINNIIIQLT